MHTNRTNLNSADFRDPMPRAWRFSHMRRVACGAARVLVVLALSLSVTLPAFSQEDAGFIDREYPLKALFLYNFGGYVEWPAKAFADARSPFVIGVYGAAPLDRTLNQIASQKAIGGRRIVIERYKNLDDIKPSQILFLSRAIPRQQQLQILEKVKGEPVLTVGETPQFAVDGGCVNFYIEANKIRFEINVEAVKQQQLKVNSKLLAMAKIIGDQPAGAR